MCGIVGFAARSPDAPREWLLAGRDRLHHRGPDDGGVWWSPDGHVGLAHRRLAIVDLSAAGHQPMFTWRKDVCIAFNGEIYNFQSLRKELQASGHCFVSDSDTEVILAAYREWGTDCLQRLHGMFAFALYDIPRQHLLLARDRAGEKPLFYAADAAGIRFSSELKALLADDTLPRRLDWTSFDCYLADGYVPAERCILQGFSKLQPAHAMLFDINSGGSRIWRYWQPPEFSGDSCEDASIDALTAEFEAVLEDAVRRQLVADVPVGVLLSGGLDSSIVTALAARAVPQVKTFTVRFPGHGSYDETEHARLVAAHFGTDHVEIDAQVADVGLLSRLARQFDEPMIDSSMVPTYLVCSVVRQHCTVVLGGDGGDELFGGYPHYDRMLRLERAAKWMPRPLRTMLASMAGHLIPCGVRGRNWLQSLDSDFNRDVPAVLQMFDPVTRRRLMRGNTQWNEVAERLRSGKLSDEKDLLQRATRLDFTTYLAEDLLVKVDRASMLTSLEVRAPMLDARVLEFAFARVPSRFKATASARKILMKRLAKRALPRAFDRSRKQGFSIPISVWLQSHAWRTFFRDVLFDSQANWFDRGLVTNMLDAEGNGRSNGERLFGLLMFELWRREYGIEMGR